MGPRLVRSGPAAEDMGPLERDAADCRGVRERTPGTISNVHLEMDDLQVG